MAAFLTWLTKWQTGVDWVDEDHREITAMLNRILDVNGRVLARDPTITGCEVLAVLDALIESSGTVQRIKMTPRPGRRGPIPTAQRLRLARGCAWS